MNSFYFDEITQKRVGSQYKCVCVCVVNAQHIQLHFGNVGKCVEKKAKPIGKKRVFCEQCHCNRLKRPEEETKVAKQNKVKRYLNDFRTCKRNTYHIDLNRRRIRLVLDIVVRCEFLRHTRHLKRMLVLVVWVSVVLWCDRFCLVCDVKSLTVLLLLLVMQPNLSMNKMKIQ